jgi:hypothetical protein
MSTAESNWPSQCLYQVTAGWSSHRGAETTPVLRYLHTEIVARFLKRLERYHAALKTHIRSVMRRIKEVARRERQIAPDPDFSEQSRATRRAFPLFSLFGISDSVRRPRGRYNRVLAQFVGAITVSAGQSLQARSFMSIGNQHRNSIFNWKLPNTLVQTGQRVISLATFGWRGFHLESTSSRCDFGNNMSMWTSS